MSRSLRAALPGIAIALFGLALQLPIHDRAVVPMDEGHLATAATRLLDGDRLYRDVHTGIFPGVYHVTALLFRLFGSDLLVTRWAQLVANLAIALALWRVALRAVAPLWAALPPLLHLCLVPVAFPVLTMFNYSSLALLLASFSLLFLLRYREGSRTADAVALGLLLAGTALTKQNLGGLVLAAVALGLLWDGRSRSLRERAAHVAPVALAAAAPVAAAAAWFAATGTLHDLVSTTLLELGASQLEHFDNPIPPIFGAHPARDARFVFLYTPPLLFNEMLHGGTLLGLAVTPGLRSLAIRLSYGVPIAALLAAPLALALVRRGMAPAAWRGAAATLTFAWLYAFGIFPSAIWSHLAFVLPPTLLALAIAGDRVGAALARAGRIPARAWAGLALGLVAAAALVAARGSLDVRRWNPVPLELPRASLSSSADQVALYRGATAFLESCARPGEPVFVAPDIPILYFLSDRRNPTPYDLTIPGNVDGALIIERLEASRTRCVLFNPRMYPEFPAFERLFPDLARYLAQRYRRAAVIGAGGVQWHGLVRKPAA